MVVQLIHFEWAANTYFNRGAPFFTYHFYEKKQLTTIHKWFTSGVAVPSVSCSALGMCVAVH